MEPAEAKKWLKSVIKQRLFTIEHNCCYRNKLLMVNTCERLNTLLKVNGYHGDNIFRFIRNHYTDILIIIPANKNEEHNLKTLKQLALCNQPEKSTPMSDSTQKHTQLACF